MCSKVFKTKKHKCIVEVENNGKIMLLTDWFAQNTVAELPRLFGPFSGVKTPCPSLEQTSFELSSFKIILLFVCFLKRCKAKYYTSKVKDLKGVNPRKWWSEVNKLSGSKKQNSSLFSSLNVPEYNNLSATEVANSINHALLEPLQPYEPIDSERAALQLPLEENPEFLGVRATCFT